MSDDIGPQFGPRSETGKNIDKWDQAPTIQDYRDRVEQITGIDFEGAKPRDLMWKDWKNLVHYLETEVENADNSETQEGGLDG